MELPSELEEIRQVLNIGGGLRTVVCKREDLGGDFIWEYLPINPRKSVTSACKQT